MKGMKDYLINNVDNVDDVININELQKYIFAGMHLKRLGDFLQVDIFNKSNLTYFQTNDDFCFLYASNIIEPYKVIILNKKTILTKIIYDGHEQLISLNHIKLHHIDIILNEIIHLINHHKIQHIQNGGSVYNKSNTKLINIKNLHSKFNNLKKVDNNIDNINTHNIYNNIMEKPLTVTINNLIDIILKIPTNPLSYLIYKIDRDNYKILLGPFFDEINDIIEHLKIFATIKPIDHKYVLEYFNSMLYFEQFMIKYQCALNINHNIFDFIRFVQEKLGDERNSIFRTYFNILPYVYFDVINNFNKYDIDYSLDLEDFQDRLIKRYSKDKNDAELKYDIFVELEKNPEYVECRSKLAKHKCWDKQLSDDEISVLQERMNELEDEMGEIMTKRIQDDDEKAKNKIVGKRETNIDIITNDCSKVIYRLVKKS